jgi:PST family polysaccharide transporter
VATGSEQGSDLAGRFARGGAIIAAANWVVQVVNLVAGLWVAKLLGPEVFGLYAFVVAVNEFIGIVKGLGVAPALVQSQEESDELYDSGYALSFLQGFVGLAVAAAMAPLLLRERGADAAWFIFLLGFARLGVLLSDVVVAKLDRHLRYGAGAWILILPRFVASALCVALAYAGWGAWSLIVRDLLLGVVPLFMAHVVARYRFRGRVDRRSLRRIFSFAAPLFVAQLLATVVQRLDRLVVGWLFGNTAIGLYDRSRFITDFGPLAAAPVTRVTFNMYSRLLAEPTRLMRAFSLVNFFLMRIFLAWAVVLIAYPAPTLRLLLGSEWVVAADALRILGLYAVVFPVLQNMEMLLYVQRRAFANVRIQLVQGAVLAPGLFAAAWLGSIPAVAASLLVSHLVAAALSCYALRDLVRGALLRLYGVPAAALAATLAVLAGLGRWEAFARLPWWALPFLPPLVFGVVIFAIDRGELLREIRYLRRQLLESPRAAQAGRGVAAG